MSWTETAMSPPEIAMSSAEMAVLSPEIAMSSAEMVHPSPENALTPGHRGSRSVIFHFSEKHVRNYIPIHPINCNGQQRLAKSPLTASHVSISAICKSISTGTPVQCTKAPRFIGGLFLLKITMQRLPLLSVQSFLFWIRGKEASIKYHHHFVFNSVQAADGFFQ
jgi:hypothetical protein